MGGRGAGGGFTPFTSSGARGGNHGDDNYYGGDGVGLVTILKKSDIIVEIY